MFTDEKSHVPSVAHSPIASENHSSKNGEFQPQSSLTPEDFLQEVSAVLKGFEPSEHSEILAQLLKRVEKINFREKAGLRNEEDKLSQGHYLIISIDEILAIAKKGNFEICQNNGFIYLYNGAFWKMTDSDEFKFFLGNAALKLGVIWSKARLYQFHDHLYKQFVATANLPKPEPPEGVTLLNLLNGTLEITQKGRTLRAPNPKDFLTYQLPFAYEPSATAPQFLKFLNRVLPDVESQNVLAEYLGYVFIQGLKLEKVLLLYGGGGNGKSVIFDIMNALLGSENISSFSLRNLTDENGYYRAMMADKLLNYASELDVSFNNTEFKQMVSGEPMAARLPHMKPIILKRYAKLMFNCNELPTNVEQTEAFFRRLLIIPFIQTITDEEKDVELAKKIIQTELAGVFNWVLQGLERVLQQKGFTQSDKVQKQLQEYRTSSDSVQMFLLEENYTSSKLNTIALKTLYNDYKQYCSDNGNKPVSNRKMSERLTKIGYTIERKNYGREVYAEKSAIF